MSDRSEELEGIVEEEKITTSISILKSQKEWLDERSKNVSAYVRKKIEEDREKARDNVE